MYYIIETNGSLSTLFSILQTETHLLKSPLVPNLNVYKSTSVNNSPNKIFSHV